MEDGSMSITLLYLILTLVTSTDQLLALSLPMNAFPIPQYLSAIQPMHSPFYHPWHCLTNLARHKTYMLDSLLTLPPNFFSAETWTHSPAHCLFLVKGSWVLRGAPRLTLGGRSHKHLRRSSKLSLPEDAWGTFGLCSSFSVTKQHHTSKRSENFWIPLSNKFCLTRRRWTNAGSKNRWTKRHLFNI